MIGPLAVAHDRFSESLGVDSAAAQELAALCHQQVDMPEVPRVLPKFALVGSEDGQVGDEDADLGDDDGDDDDDDDEEEGRATKRRRRGGVDEEGEKEEKERQQARKRVRQHARKRSTNPSITAQLHARGLELLKTIEAEWEKMRQEQHQSKRLVMPGGNHGGGGSATDNEKGEGGEEEEADEEANEEEWLDPHLIFPKEVFNFQMQLKYALIEERMRVLGRKLSDIYKDEQAGKIGGREMRVLSDRLYLAERQWVEQEYSGMNEKTNAARYCYQETALKWRRQVGNSTHCWRLE
jgi:hypothetical protein